MLIGSSVHQEEGLLTEFQRHGWLGYLRNLSYISNFRSFEACQISQRGLLKSLAFRRKDGLPPSWELSKWGEGEEVPCQLHSASQMYASTWTVVFSRVHTQLCWGSLGQGMTILFYVLRKISLQYFPGMGEGIWDLMAS